MVWVLGDFSDLTAPFLFGYHGCIGDLFHGATKALKDSNSSDFSDAANIFGRIHLNL